MVDYQRAGVQVPKGRGAATKMQGLGYQRAGVCLQKGKGVTPQGQGCDYCRGGWLPKRQGCSNCRAEVWLTEGKHSVKKHIAFDV